MQSVHPVLPCWIIPPILESGSAYRKAHPGAVEAELEKGSGDELATIIFTSGTTGEPKGVMLSHSKLHESARRIAETHYSVSRGQSSLRFTCLAFVRTFVRICDPVFCFCDNLLEADWQYSSCRHCHDESPSYAFCSPNLGIRV